jgi:hypothetical protein
MNYEDLTYNEYLMRLGFDLERAQREHERNMQEQLRRGQDIYWNEARENNLMRCDETVLDGRKVELILEKFMEKLEKKYTIISKFNESI